MTNCYKLKLKKGNVPDSQFNKRQLAIGMKVEREHSNDPMIAKQIAKSHLVEDKNYYFKLKKAGL